MINMSTGPVGFSSALSTILSKQPYSHRSKEFEYLHSETSEFLCSRFNVNNVFLMQGSGTLANDAMIWQIKQSLRKGLILSNGEFGNRLIQQAHRASLDFETHSIDWGMEFDVDQIQTLFDTNDFQWVLFVHCETSTGILNPLEHITKLSKAKNLNVFVDCMSTVGTMKVDLSEVAMATCSSGKGLCSVPGIAVVLSNIEASNGAIPTYLDLASYGQGQTPFTFLSNHLEALSFSCERSLNDDKWQRLDECSLKLFEAFHGHEMIPFARSNCRIFTFVPKEINSVKLGDDFFKTGIELSYRSGYLTQRNWFQLALFSEHSLSDVDFFIGVLNDLTSNFRAFNSN